MLRYVEVVVDPRAPNNRLIATIGHELHHALEVLAVPGVLDPQRVVALYREIGNAQCFADGSTTCETDGALATEQLILRELFGGLEVIDVHETESRSRDSKR